MSNLFALINLEKSTLILSNTFSSKSDWQNNKVTYVSTSFGLSAGILYGSWINFSIYESPKLGLSSDAAAIMSLYSFLIAFDTINLSAAITKAVFGTFKNSLIASRFSIMCRGKHLSRSSINTTILPCLLFFISSSKSFLNSLTASYFFSFSSA